MKQFFLLALASPAPAMHTHTHTHFECKNNKFDKKAAFSTTTKTIVVDFLHLHPYRAAPNFFTHRYISTRMNGANPSEIRDNRNAYFHIIFYEQQAKKLRSIRFSVVRKTPKPLFSLFLTNTQTHTLQIEKK